MNYHLNDEYPTVDSTVLAIRNHLRFLARNRTVTTYSKLIEDLSLPYSTRMGNDRKVLGNLLGQISTADVEAHRPPSSILVVKKSSMKPSFGFFDLMRTLNPHLTIETPDDEDLIFGRTLAETFTYWSNH